MEVEERRQALAGEDVHVAGEADRDVLVAQVLAHHVGVLALDEGVVVGVPGRDLVNSPTCSLFSSVHARLQAGAGQGGYDASRERYETAHSDAETGVTVTPTFIATG